MCNAAGCILIVLGTFAAVPRPAIQQDPGHDARAGTDRGDRRQLRARLRNLQRRGGGRGRRGAIHRGPILRDGPGHAAELRRSRALVRGGLERRRGSASRSLARLYELGRGVPRTTPGLTCSIARRRKAATRSPSTRSASSWTAVAAEARTPQRPRSTTRSPPRPATTAPSSPSPGCMPSGRGVTRDRAAADHWYAEAVKQIQAKASAGDLQAQERLGRLYLDGEGVPRDTQQGSFRLAQHRGPAWPVVGSAPARGPVRTRRG